MVTTWLISCFDQFSSDIEEKRWVKCGGCRTGEHFSIASDSFCWARRCKDKRGVVCIERRLKVWCQPAKIRSNSLH